MHCDPHPGNILVRPHPDDHRRAQIVVIDHGLCIPLSEQFRSDYRCVPLLRLSIFLHFHTVTTMILKLTPLLPPTNSLLWRSLFVADLPTIERIAVSWGIAAENSDMLASATLLKPHRVRKQTLNTDGTKIAKTTYEQQTGLKDRLRSMLQSEELIPRVSCVLLVSLDRCCCCC